jgi:tRNA threonylcarbamoyladenosine biosynthesis protein TsaB
MHATDLLSEIERAATAAGGWGEVESIAVGVGPGSFTGLRVGIATARALGLSRGIPVAGVGTLDALGRGLGERGAGVNRLAVLDARRGEVFAALCGAGGERVWNPFVCPPAALAERLGALTSPTLAAGSGAVRFRQELAGPSVEIPDDADPSHRIAARHICALAATGVGAEAEPAAPNYLRPPDAERWRERDTIQTTE